MTRKEVEEIKQAVTAQGEALRAEMAAQGQATRQELRSEMAAQGQAIRQELRAEMATQGEGLRSEMAAQGQALRGEMGSTARVLENEFRRQIGMVADGVALANERLGRVEARLEGVEHGLAREQDSLRLRVDRLESDRR